ncbi:T6SS immunity protein Tli4 family protein [Massilia sp. YIM B02763]|uniref:T6SS immunity protein Tli4 family protein n=1 Tax=Massilia sp. YIM B02763 TaxID=3050130 RepID=UPI0025B66F2A|nr:T6SS immunity protein Tli4 family protein [Massilia sp. YIM B02763]MDN4054303.1 T6SS immunity protein Tli4 family protein [Massilia sp. YIM B02763]
MFSLKRTYAGWKKRLLPAVLLAFVGIWGVDCHYRARDMSEVEKMSAMMRTVCVGRFLIDVPARAEVTLSRQMISGFEVDTVEESESDFVKRMTAREADIAVSGADGKQGGMVEARDLRVPGMRGRTFIHGRSRGYLMEGERRVPMESVSVESHAHLDGFSFSLSAKFTKESSAAEAEALLARLQLRGEDEVPFAPGFCIWRGSFVEPLPTHKNEHIAMHMGLANHPDLAVGLSSMPGGGADADLLARVAETDAAASADELLRITKLREQTRVINGIGGEEVLEKVRELNFTTGYGFMWEARGATVGAGDQCPQSGWWRCSESGPGVDVQGGAVQFIRQGERMPQALLLPRATMWQKLRSVQPSVELRD